MYKTLIAILERAKYALLDLPESLKNLPVYLRHFHFFIMNLTEAHKVRCPFFVCYIISYCYLIHSLREHNPQNQPSWR